MKLIRMEFANTANRHLLLSLVKQALEQPYITAQEGPLKQMF